MSHPRRWRRTLLRYHLWLGWLVGIPLLLWTVSGLVMVARPIDEVRGGDLRIQPEVQALPAGFSPVLPFLDADEVPVRDYRLAMREGRAVARVGFADDRQALFDATTGAQISPIGEAEARRIVRAQIRTARVGEAIAGTTLFAAANVPLDFRKAIPAWQVRLTDGTHVYVGRDTGEIEAVRTRFWRFYDVMWGLHIMDLQAREDTHHPILIVFAAISGLAIVLAVLLMIARYAPRRRARE